MDDIWYVIDLLKEEVIEHNKKHNKKFEIHQSILSHVPFFTCTNHFLDKDLQRDIQRYNYCIKMKVPPYKGSYGNQPKKWIDKCNIIEKMLNYIQKKEYNKSIKSNELRSKSSI